MEDRDKLDIFESEAKTHINEIYRVALRMTRNKEDAEELVQETYMQAWLSFDKYEAGTNCRAWLHRILFHKNSHARRKKHTQSRFFRDVDEFVMDNAVDVSEVPEHLTDKTVIKALDRLPDHYRSPILLVDVYEFRYKEVSSILDVPIGTIMSRLNRGRRILRKYLFKTAVEIGIIQ